MIIAIVHHQSNKPFLDDLLKSLEGVKYPVKIYENDPDNSRFELGVLQKALDEFDDDVFLIQDSCEIKDLSLFDKAAQHTGGLALCHRFMSYLGKYKREILRQMEIPIVTDKESAIHHELHWNSDYMSRDPNFMYLDPMSDNDQREEKHGRVNMILENQWIKKYKATFR